MEPSSLAKELEEICNAANEDVLRQTLEEGEAAIEVRRTLVRFDSFSVRPSLLAKR